MAEAVQFAIGAHAICTDGPCGEVRQVVVDPVARAVTHLVIEPEHRFGLGRLVPVDLVDVAGAEVRLGCTVFEFEQLDSAEDTQFVPGTRGYEAYGPEQVIAWPYYGLGGEGVSGELVEGISQTVTYDMVPLGEVEVRRDARVHAVDGEIGRVQGLVVESGSHHVTHVLLQEGHLWGRKDVAIPISAVTAVDDDGVHVSMTKHDLEQLPAVPIDR